MRYLSNSPLGRRLVPFLVLAIGLVLSWNRFDTTKLHEELRLKSALEQQVDWRVGDLEDRIVKAASPVQALAAFIGADPAPSPEDFSRFAQRARSVEPVSRLVWAPWVKGAQRENFEREARQSGLNDYAIRGRAEDGSMRVAPARDAYLPIRYVERFDASSSDLGFDLLTAPGRPALVEAARDQGAPVAAPPLLSLTHPENLPNYVIFWPVYATHGIPPTVAERRAAFLGVAIGVYPIADMIEFAMAAGPRGMARLDLYVDRASDTLPVAIFHGDSNVVEFPRKPPAPANGVTLTRTFPLFGHDWTVEQAFPEGAGPLARSNEPWLSAALGVVLTVMLFLYSFRQGRMRAVIEGEVRTRTEALTRTSEELRAIIDASPFAIANFDLEHRVTLWNKRAEILTGYSAEEVMGEFLPASLGGMTGESLARMHRGLAGEIMHGLASKRVRKDGVALDTLSSVAAFFDSNGVMCGITTATEDVTERNSMQRQLQQAQKMEAIGQLTGGIAHDFNNLLGVVIGSMEVLRDSVPRNGDQASLIDTAIHASLRGAELTRQLLAFARQQPLAPTLTEVDAVLEKSRRLLQRSMGGQIVVRFELPTNLWPVVIDATQLESSILNLAVNARDAMPAGGTLTVEADNIELDPEGAAFDPDVRPGRYVRVTVSDTGAGMTPEVLARVFDPFFTTKGTKGTGLGLSMVHGFVRQSGGHTRIYSEPGRGTTFHMYLPRAETPAAAIVEEAPRAKPAGGEEIILVVEDNDALRDMALRVLKNLGYQTLCANDGTQALSILEGGAAVDLLFTDIVMPGGFDGRELARRARLRRPALRVLYTSGFTPAAASVGDGLNLNLISKPYRREELARRIRATLEEAA